ITLLISLSSILLLSNKTVGQSLHFISDIEWNADGTLLALSRISGEIEIYDSETNTLVYELDYDFEGDRYQWGLHDLAWHPDGVHIAFNQLETGVVVFNVQTQEIDAVGEISEIYGVTRLIWSPDGTIL